MPLLHIVPDAVTEIKIDYTSSKQEFQIDKTLSALHEDLSLVPNLANIELIPSDGPQEFFLPVFVELLVARSSGTDCAVLDQVALAKDPHPGHSAAVDAQFSILEDYGMSVVDSGAIWMLNGPDLSGYQSIGFGGSVGFFCLPLFML
jgi:hypothetical protein